MTISKDLFLAILSMDAYNQGYNKGLDHGKIQIGAATKIIESDTEVSAETSASAAASFYAVAYDISGSGIAELDGTTVISYRGTDEPASEFFGTDLPLSTFDQWRSVGWAIGTRNHA